MPHQSYSTTLLFNFEFMKARKIVVILMVTFTVLLSSFSFYGYQILKAPNILVGKEGRTIVIPNDATFLDVQNLLYDQDIVQDPVSFSFLAKLMDYDKLVKPGRYEFAANMTNREAIRMLRAGSQATTFITFNNVRLKEDLAKKICQTIELDEGAFLVALEEFTTTSDLNKDNVMTLFIPNTYEVYWTASGAQIIERMKAEHTRFWNEDRIAKAVALNLSPIEVSILASIVQAESVKYDEKPIIAGLYLNRIRQGIALQADPTLVFASGDFGLKRVLNVHKEIESPYNTYKYKGLPPGPINLPEISSIDAVLDHEEHDYLYMCAKEDFSGYHAFASDYNDHLANARRYQRQLSIEQRKARQNK